MSHEDADAEQHSCCRDDFAHSFPPWLTGESSTGSFPDDFAELGKWFRRPGRRRRPGTNQLHGIAGSATGISNRPFPGGGRFAQRADCWRRAYASSRGPGLHRGTGSRRAGPTHSTRQSRTPGRRARSAKAGSKEHRAQCKKTWKPSALLLFCRCQARSLRCLSVPRIVARAAGDSLVIIARFRK
jgi:hypothetical protein